MPIAPSPPPDKPLAGVLIRSAKNAKTPSVTPVYSSSTICPSPPLCFPTPPEFFLNALFKIRTGRRFSISSADVDEIFEGQLTQDSHQLVPKRPFLH